MLTTSRKKHPTPVVFPLVNRKYQKKLHKITPVSDTFLLQENNSIENRIFTIRGVPMMLDSNLARLYQVETKVLNQAVKRNIERFPDWLMFQLRIEEWLASRSQIVTLNKIKRGQNLKYLPYA